MVKGKVGKFILLSCLSLSLKVRGYKPCRHKNLPNEVKKHFRRELKDRYGANYSRITFRNYTYYQFRYYRVVWKSIGGQAGDKLLDFPKLSKRLTWKKRTNNSMPFDEKLYVNELTFRAYYDGCSDPYTIIKERGKVRVRSKTKIGDMHTVDDVIIKPVSNSATVYVQLYRLSKKQYLMYKVILNKKYKRSKDITLD